MHRNRFIKRRACVFGFLVALLLACAGAAFAGGLNVKVIILPFDMHAEGDISATRRVLMDGLAVSLSRAGAEITGIDVLKELVLQQGVKNFNEASAIELSKRVSADFAVLGSLTRLGNFTNADLRLVDLKSGEVAAFYYKSSGSEAEILAKIKETADLIYEKMLKTIKSKPVVRTGKVDAVFIEGNRRIDTDAILKKVASKPGEQFSPDDVKEDLRAIYSTGFFDDVFADLSETAGGKALTYVVKEMPFIKKIEIQGNSEVKEEKIKDALTLKENTALSRTSLAENVAKIKAVYAEEGYYLAKITPVLESDGVEATIVFKINEGPEVKVKRITFIGNANFSKSDLLDAIETSEVGWWSFVSGSGKFNEYVFQNDLALIINHYFNNGYINADIVDHRVLLSDDKKWFYVTIAVNEGEQFKVASLDVKGDMLTTKKEVLEKFKLKKGDIFNRSKFSKDIDAVSDYYGDKGYAYADVRPLTNLNMTDKTIDITIDIKKNDLVYIERIDMTGNVRTRDKVIRRELEVEEGNLFSSTDVKMSKQNLKRLGYFEDVKINQTRGSGDDKMKIDVEVKERPTGAISIGAGYSSVDKLIGTASVSQTNFLGTGLRLELTGTVSASSSRYSFGFTEPWLFDKPISAGFDLYNSEKTYPDFKIRKNGFDLRAGFPITKRSTRGYLTYRLEDVHIINVASSASSYILDQAGSSTLSSLRATVKRDTRDDAFFAHEGSVQTLSSELAGGPLGGTTAYLKHEGDAIQYFPLAWDTTFSLHGAVGYVQGYGGKAPPVYEKYFLGGINSVRGFKTRSLGPADPATGNLLGGDTMAVFNAEYTFPLFSKQSIRGLLFFDAGNAYKGAIDLGQLRTGAGTGIRWYSPIGPLRLELGFNLKPKPYEAKEQWDFTIGTMF
ncbi:outer membrane protein assembly factor BamA [bacterium]|nr:MAG: outer membrane protein assembly factor BamA [bacterium]